MNGLREGKGVWHYSNGVVYEGAFERDFKQGKGRENYPSGEYFVGDFVEGTKFKGKFYDSKDH